MKTEFLKSKHGYDIPFHRNIPKGAKRIVIVCHGFGSSKDSVTAHRMLCSLSLAGLGAVAFDFPAHGESEAGVEQLLVENCIDNIGEIEQMICEEYPEAEIGYFGSSFGGFCDLLYLTKKEHLGDRAFLRSGAVNMADFFREVPEEAQKILDEKGCILAQEEPPVVVPKAFVEEMQTLDLYRDFAPKDGDDLRVTMIHGTEDEEIDVNKAEEFAAKFEIPIILLEGGHHNLAGEGMPERVAREAILHFSC